MSAARPEPIAIVGSGCRFPGGSCSPSALWDLLERPRDVCTEIPTDRFNVTGHYHPDGSHHGTTNVRHSYLLQENVRNFDAAFFNISPSEADSMDPQQRLLLETVYEALEAGGHTLESLRASDTAVYVGTMGVDYNDTLLRDLATIPTYFATGTNRAIISNRVSYFFDWHGPSMTIDTACSSSLVAVHQGVRALRSGESRVAIACGTQMILGPEVFIFESKMKMLSPTGRSRMWDAGADGYARGEGVAAIVLKRLSDAVADGDHIECLIRETGSNQDGYSNGITVPNTEAQVALIRKTYSNAGLDPDHNPYDGPQFFEAHGTGTQAGDPKEAAAIARSFPNRGDSSPLYVGSVKTVIGHTEGAAGLAGVLKASGIIQRGFIPPNLLFNKLNPSIEPFYAGLSVPTSLKAWPELPKGVPRRVSVNSFGFGGSNAHAILEQYSPGATELRNDINVSSLTPLVFSAASESSLRAQLEAYASHLRGRGNIDISNLAWTLQSRRSQFPFRVAFSASSVNQLVEKIEDRLNEVKRVPGSTVATRSQAKTSAARVLGVFTGQGAQWPAMGAELIRVSPFVRQRIQDLEASLCDLPVADRPQWKLKDEMLAGADASRLSEAALSQPLCTAVQIVLVDMLRAAGINFSAVVGHSSGEIGAAYAAGFLSDRDAIRIAYYRGFDTVSTINSKRREKGLMLAVGTSLDDAKDLINLRAFRGRIAIAAHNSSASVTLSGDEEAVYHAKRVFDEEKKFCRILQVDTAYHSHHMLPRSEPYLEALRKCGIRVNYKRDTSCAWFSSVLPSKIPLVSNETLQGTYWKDNMVNTVLFADAIRNAVASDPQLNYVLEIGPHPALKGPATQNITEVISAGLPYSGVLSRGKNDIAAVSDTLAFVWTLVGSSGVDFTSYNKLVSATNLDPKLICGLPSYVWDHKRAHWLESRKSRKIRGRKEVFHELLGAPLPDSTPHDRRWSNVLKLSEIPWLQGHQLQGQAVFPAAGYCALALEAAKTLAADDTVQVIELADLSIPRAITFDSEAGVETLVTLTSISRDQAAITAQFSCYSCPVVRTDSEMELMASGNVRVALGEPRMDALSSTPSITSNMTDVESDRFYASLEKLGYGYADQFRTMTSIKRRLNEANVLVDSFDYPDDAATIYMVHPTWLDVAFQSCMLAFSAPGDERLWSLHVPTSIRRIRVNPELCASLPLCATAIPVSAVLANLDTISGCIDIFGGDQTENTMVQVEDLNIKPFAPATEADDHLLFSHTKLEVAFPNGALTVADAHPSPEEIELGVACERVAYYFCRQWKAAITNEEWENSQNHYLALRDWMNYTLEKAALGQHPYIKREWASDTWEQIKAIVTRYTDDADIKLLVASGENMPAAVRGQTTILEHLHTNNLLYDYYEKGLGFAQYNKFLAGMMKQIVHRYPHARILEIGAGTGGATKAVLERVGKKMSSYTYTDVSVGFFEKASTLFKAYGNKMIFKTLDIEKPAASQGYKLHSYDIVIASNVLHATHSLQKTLENTRQLLKPGGFLMLLEITNNGPARFGGIMGGFPGWWFGVDDGRQYAPTITPREWDQALNKAGFAGVDSMTPEIDGLAWPFSIIAAQAVDDRINFLREPLASISSPNSIYIDTLVILAKKTPKIARISEELCGYLGPVCGQIITLDGLPTEIDARAINPMSTFVNLVDLGTPIFQEINSLKMEGLKRVYGLARHILWVTEGALENNPYHMASIAFSRVVCHEASHISMNHLDISEATVSVPHTIAEHLLRQSALDEWEVSGKKQQQQTFMWSKEPEVFLHGSQFKIPRLLDDSSRNARLNSGKRVITERVPPGSNISVQLSADASPTMIQQLAHTVPQGAENLLKIRSSSLMALRIHTDTFLFLALGKAKNPTSTQDIILLSQENSREVIPVAATPIALTQDADRLLVAVANQLLASSLLEAFPSGSSILVHCDGKHRFLAAALTIQARAKSVRIAFSYDFRKTGHDKEPLWIKLDACWPVHVLRKALAPLKPSHFLDLTAGGHKGETNELGLSIKEALPGGCNILAQSELVRTTTLLSKSANPNLLTTVLRNATAGSKQLFENVNHTDINDQIIPLTQLSDVSRPNGLSTIISWEVEGDITVHVRPLDAKYLFSRSKSYLLIGLSGQIGQSLCEWMVANGAGYVWLASRNPHIDAQWLASFKNTGATVKSYAVDITNKKALEKLVEDINATCPPIAGVANGAMVLHDCLFDGMTAEMMQKVLAPKIDGSNHLDQIFSNPDLEFFVMFSSLVCVFGNSGQSNYAAANGYINGLARQRRSRGLPASAIDIGRVSGIGYVEKAGQVVVDQLTRTGLVSISEIEVREMFAEAIQAGYPKAEDKHGFPEAVITTGLRTFREDENIQVPWLAKPLLSHWLLEVDAATVDEGSSRERNTLPVIKQIARATSKNQALEILQECFSAKLRIILQLTEESMDLEIPLIQLGVDSLVAVEIRSWFLKELKVDIPVLKVIGGASISDLCQGGVEGLPADFIGSVQAVETVEENKEEANTSASAPAPDLPGSTPTVSEPSSASEGASTPTTPLATPQLSTQPSSEDMKFTKIQNEAISAQRFMKTEPLSFGQSRFWFLRILLEDQTTSNVTFYYRVEGNIRIGDLQKAVRVVTNRHESLRTCFVEDEHKADQAYQNVLPSSAVRLEYRKIGSMEELASEYQQLQEHVFDLSGSVPLLRLVLLSISPTTHFLLLSYHHIIMDGVSAQVFLADLEKAYTGQTLGPAPRQFPDYSRAQRQAFEDGRMNDELNYWRGVFPADEQPPVLPLLPMARTSSRTAMRDFSVHHVKTRIAPGLMARIRSVSKAQRSTPFHFYLAAYKAMLFSLTNADDLTIGIADANRNDEDVAGSIGFFLNLLALRFRRNPNQSVADAVGEARDITYTALANSRVPFDVLLNELNVSRSSAHSPFFQAFFDYRQGAQEEHPWGNCHFKIQEVHPGRTAYDVSLDIADGTNDSLIMLRTQKALYDSTAAELLLETYVHFLNVLSKDTSQLLEIVPLFSEKQLSRAAEIGRGPKLESDWPETLPLRIDYIAQQNPDKIALVDGVGNSLSYSRMTKRIEAIAEELQRAGLGNHSRVLVFQTAASDWVCSMLAIMRIGGIYIPLDLRNPVPRLATMAADCKPSAILADNTTIDDAAKLTTPEAHIVNISSIASQPSKSVKNVSRGPSPAAILYTSGSTGSSKGIIVTHAGLRNEIEGYTSMWGLGAEHTLQQSAFTFNHSSDQIYTGLVNGGTVYIVPSEKRGDPSEITKLLKENDITYTKATPSEYLLWMQFGGENLAHCSQWRFAFGGGESLTSTVTSGFAQLDLPQLRLYNSYGPTEISISSTKMELDYRNQAAMENGVIPCGYSLPNYFLYVLDEQLRIVPAGMPGELYLGGAGVSLGYLNNEKLTSKHFIMNPFATSDDIANGWDRLYCTGDIGHLQSDGAMVFHKRVAGDSQVKIRGLRIELSDIESNIILAAGGTLREAVVTLRQGDPEFLAVHVAFASNHSISDQDAFLSNLLIQLPLPQYMIPVVAVPLKKLPLTNHSKVDRVAIQNMALPRRTAAAGDIKDFTETMRQLKKVWEFILNNKELGLDIGPTTNFFHVGGNSLLVLRLQAQIRNTFNVTIHLVELLGSSSLKQMAHKIEESAIVAALDWEEETAPPVIPAFLRSVPKAFSTLEKKTILITGATGFLARHIIPRLVSDPRIEELHCVAVRKQSAEEISLLSKSDKVVIHMGDLTQPLLGLPENEFLHLSGKADVIFHFGGARSFWDNYNILRSSNVQPTKELAKLASSHQIPIHYISTIGVFPHNVFHATSAAAHPPATDGSNGYVASRWASERILERSAESFGVRSTIHRFLTTSDQGPSMSILDDFVRFIDISGIMPDLGSWEGRLGMMPADKASNIMCQFAFKQQSESVSFVHHHSPISVDVAELREYVEENRGSRGLERMPGLRWIGLIKKLGWPYFLTGQDITIGSSTAGSSVFHSRR